MQQLPKISVITPSFNQGHYIEQTIQSVLGQNYPNLEYIVIDGGSNDNTIDIIKKYEGRLAYWVSEKDSGQANAINKGFAKATGDILCWLNSDDMFMPGIFSFIANELNTSEAMIVTGSCIRYLEAPEGLRTAAHSIISDRAELSLKDVDYIMQPSTFWTRKAWEQVGNLNEQLHFIFDWDWFLRAESKQVQMKTVTRTLSLYRIHGAQKTGTEGGNRNNETLQKKNNEIIGLYWQYAPENIPVFQKLISNKGRMNNTAGKILRNLLRAAKVKKRDVRLLKMMFPEFNKIDNSKLEGIYLATV